MPELQELLIKLLSLFEQFSLSFKTFYYTKSSSYLHCFPEFQLIEWPKLVSLLLQHFWIETPEEHPRSATITKPPDQNPQPEWTHTVRVQRFYTDSSTLPWTRVETLFVLMQRELQYGKKHPSHAWCWGRRTSLGTPVNYNETGKGHEWVPLDLFWSKSITVRVSDDLRNCVCFGVLYHSFFTL